MLRKSVFLVKTGLLAGLIALSLGACTTYTGTGYSAGDLTGDTAGSARGVNGVYTVRAGDTLHSVAFANNIDLKLLAYINDIKKPYNINKGQRLILDPARVGVRTHRVQKNDTVYALSRKFGIPMKDLVSINDIDSNYTIMVGQLLAVSRKSKNPVPVAASGSGSASSRNTAPTVISTAQKPDSGRVNTPAQKPVTPVNTPAASASRGDNAPDMTVSGSRNKKENTRAVDDVRIPAQARGSVSWKWPVQGRIIEGFSNSEHGNKGIDISGARGSDIKAASGGKVVYAGNALRGYGNLIILSHNDDFLSAYAHNDSILVREGQQVSRGQVIAKMGDSEAKSVRLHFEIRYRGQTVNPMKYLPQGRK